METQDSSLKHLYDKRGGRQLVTLTSPPLRSILCFTPPGLHLYNRAPHVREREGKREG